MEHISVLLDESIDMLQVKPDGIYVDCTLGRGGHSSKILEKLTTGRLIAFDLDQNAIDESRKRLEAISDRFTLVHARLNSSMKNSTSWGSARWMAF